MTKPTIPAQTEAVKRWIAYLRNSAESSAKAQSWLAEAKTERQTDGGEYNGCTREQTVEWAIADYLASRATEAIEPPRYDTELSDEYLDAMRQRVDAAKPDGFKLTPITEAIGLVEALKQARPFVEASNEFMPFEDVKAMLTKIDAALKAVQP